MRIYALRAGFLQGGPHLCGVGADEAQVLRDVGDCVRPALVRLSYAPVPKTTMKIQKNSSNPQSSKYTSDNYRIHALARTKMYVIMQGKSEDGGS